MMLADQAAGTVDWWARGIGIAALTISGLALAERVVEWWIGRRVKFTVTGTAGVVQIGSLQWAFYEAHMRMRRTWPSRL